MIMSVQSVFGDYFPINEDMWSLNLRGCLSNVSRSWEHELERITKGILACLLSLQVRPNIRYQSASGTAKEVASVMSVCGFCFVDGFRSMLTIRICLERMVRLQSIHLCLLF